MNDQVRQLLEKSQQYLRSAAVLLEIGDYDSCASRAYFAMFYAAQAALRTSGTPAGSRRSVRSAFIDHFVDRGRFPQRAAEALQQAYELQEAVDYAQRPFAEENEAEQVLGEAEAFIGSIDALVRKQRPEPSPAGSKKKEARQTDGEAKSGDANTTSPEKSETVPASEKASRDADAEEKTDESPSA